MVAAAALSLLVVTLVFAIDGFTGAEQDTTARAAFVIKSQPPTPADVREPRAATPVLIRKAPAAPPRSDRVVRSTPKRDGISTAPGDASQPSFTPRVRDLDPAAPSNQAPAVEQPKTGDAVREVGEAVSSTVSDTGQAADGVTATLGPPVSQAVQDVLDVVIGLLEGATDGVAGTLDKTLG